mgnify:CR=1 FL=1
MTGAQPSGGPAAAAGAGRPLSRIDRVCGLVDRLNEHVGRAFGVLILVVTFAVVYEVVARSFFGKATLWASETTIYLSAVVYLVAGGYALRHRRHVRIDVVYAMFSERAQRRLDVFASLFFFLYVGALVWIGSKLAWTSFLIREGTGTPWNPPIWPVKAAIPLAGLLLLLQGLADLIRLRNPQPPRSE